MKTLIICPHLDDETISCGGLIQRRRMAGIRVGVAVMHTRGYDYNRRDGWEEQYQHYEKVQKMLDFQDINLGRPCIEGEPGSVGYYKLLEKVENAIDMFQPTELIIPAADDLNQDHRHLHHVCKIALRPVNLQGINKVLEFLAVDGITRQPSYFLPLSDKTLEWKLKALECYKTEVRTSGPRSRVNLVAQARVWGAQCGHEFAEAFRLHFQRE